jgi:phage portal protein BeeE
MPARVLVPRGASEGDGNERLVNHPVELLFCREANPELAAFQFTEMALLSTIFEGIFFAETERDQLGRPLALWPLRAERMDVYHDPQSLALQYYYRNSTQGVVTLDPHDVFHLAGPRIYGALGMSVISYARQSLGVAIAQERLDRSAAGRRPFLQIDTHSLVKANTQAFYQSLAFGRQWGFLSANDCRTLLGLEPIGPEGDIYLQPLNMEPAEAS